MTQPVYTYQTVLEQLTAEGHLAEDQRAHLTAEVSRRPGPLASPAWYMQTFVALGAWLAVLFFLTAVLFFIMLMSPSAIEASLVGLGLLFGAVALGLRRLIGAPSTNFAANLALALSLLGQIVFLVGVGLSSKSVTTTALTALGLQVLWIAVYPDRLQRFLCVLALGGALLVLCAEWHLQEAIHLLIWTMALAMVWFWANEAWVATTAWEDLARPVAHGVAFACLGTLGFSIVANLEVWPATWWITTLGLLLILLGWAYLALGQLQLQANRPLVLGGLGGLLLVLLPTLPAPGIVAALLVLGIGFQRNHRGLMGLAMAFFVVFLIAFYYNLDFDLFWKSLMLLGTGLACLALRGLLRLRPPTPEATP